jgi:hypothetical protein
MKSDKKTNKILISFSSALLLITGLGGISGGEASAANAAIKGYDTVAYFTLSKPIKGSESFTFTWHNMAWYFLTKENRDMFATMPEKYAPQYDGYCAWAMSEARKAIVDPEEWQIVSGKLYLNCSKAAYEKWSKDIPGNIRKADANWINVFGGK